MSNPFRHVEPSPETLRLAVTMSIRLLLYLRNAQDRLTKRGIDFSHGRFGIG